MKNKDHEIEEFLSNKDFVEWVINPSDEKDYFWNKWLENHPEKKDAVNRAIFIVKTVHHNPRKSVPLKYNQILNDVLKEEYSPRGRIANNSSKSTLNLLKIAASLIILFGVGYYFLLFTQYDSNGSQIVEQRIKYAPKGKKLTFLLPDGTLVTLNSDSRIAYPASFEEKDERQVSLSGEAYFDISHNPDRPFEVKTGDVTITALGTSFNVNAYPNVNLISVALITGKVRIDNTNFIDKKEVYLSPGNKYIFDKETDKVINTTFEVDTEIAWKNGILIFDSDGVNSFIKKIEKWYGVEVEVRGEPKEEWDVSGRFNNLSLELLLESVQYIQDIEYSINQNKVVLQFKN